MNVVGIGGGTGLPALLRGLKQLRDRGADGADRVSATGLVCVSDDGGSSGFLRRALGIPAVGDLRNCMVALSSGNPLWLDVFQYRLGGIDGLDGHPLGNLIVAALSERSGNLLNAVQLASQFLDLQGSVLPSTEVCARLCAEFQDGSTARGETRITAIRKPIRRVWLEPNDAPPAAGVLDAIAAADAIVFGPGSLHTSIIPNLLPHGIAAAIQDSVALKILVCNLMTQPGETDGYSASEHVAMLQEYIGPRGIQICLLNSRPISESSVIQYRAAGAIPVREDDDAVEQRGVVPVRMDLLAEGEWEIRHDPMKLARWVVALTRAYQRARDLRMGDVRCFSRDAALASGAVAVS
jgi:uncharacterized cofD-like protein